VSVWPNCDRLPLLKSHHSTLVLGIPGRADSASIKNAGLIVLGDFLVLFWSSRPSPRIILLTVDFRMRRPSTSQYRFHIRVAECCAA